jgi:hypothetical protein
MIRLRPFTKRQYALRATVIIEILMFHLYEAGAVLPIVGDNTTGSKRRQRWCFVFEESVFIEIQEKTTMVALNLKSGGS